MSTSAADHLKLAQAQGQLAEAAEEREEIEEAVEHWEEQLAEIQARVEEVRRERERCATAEQAAQQAVEEAQKEAENKDNGDDDVDDDVDPRTGTAPGEKLPLLEDHVQYIAVVHNVREAMEQGDLESARSLEQRATKLRSQLDDSYHVDPRALAVISKAYQVSHADFCKPFGFPSEEALEKTFSFARAPRNNRHTTGGMSFDVMISLLSGVNPSLPRGYPKDVNARIMKEILEQRHRLEAAHREERTRVQAAAPADSDDDEEDEGNNSDEEEDTFEMTATAWDSVETAIRNRINQSRKKNDVERTPPYEDSSPIARYNPKAHFQFKSDHARESVHVLDEALVRCKLRSRPTKWSFQKDAANQRMRMPFEYLCSGGMDGFDVDGDCIATCGDLSDDSFRTCQTYVAHMPVPCAVNVESAQFIEELKDSTTGNSKPWEEETLTTLFKGSRRKEKLSFSRCIVDASESRVWASSSSSGTVHAFSTISGVNKADRKVGLLAFDPIERKGQRKFVNSRYDIVRCGPLIVGSAGTNRLSTWKMQEAVEEYLYERTDFGDDTTHGSESSERSTEEPKPKKPKGSPYKGLAPQILLIEEGGFAAGDVQPLSDSQVVIGPARGDSSGDDFSATIRLFDIESESVAGLFCGNQEDVSIERQYCVESSNLFFSTDRGVAIAWDCRTFQPAIMLHSNKRFIRVLGVPGNSSTAAFTFGPSLEEIACWDLRMPASHAYTMGTGNLEVKSLFWHENTSSLLAATRSEHVVSHGHLAGYMYGEALTSDDEEEVYMCDFWPRGAQHDRNYFSHSGWHCERPVILQYPFENGQTMGLLTKQS